MLKETWNDTWLEYLAKIFGGSEMAYNTTVFFLFLAVFLCVYFLMRKPRGRRNWILIGSLVFYAWSGWEALIIVLFTAVVVYWTTRRMEKVYGKYEAQKEQFSQKEQVKLLVGYKKRTKQYFLTALILILAIWIFVKAGRLMGWETVTTFAEVWQRKGMIVPLGISYYSLSAIGYMLEVYWRRVKPEHNFLNLFTVMIYFPHIVQGPISRYDGLLKQLKVLPSFQYERVCQGLQLMLWGYIKKMVIADRLVVYTSAVFGDPMNFAGVEMLLAVILSVFQLYADFSGCMDIVRGISEAVGIDLDENFRQPLFARDAQEFWSRWHITLGAWSKDYLYLPIALNPRFMKMTSRMKKEGKKRLSAFLRGFCPLIAVWLFTGLWHGTGLDYLAWGMYWCLLMTIAQEGRPLFQKLTKSLKINPDTAAYRIFQAVRTSMLFAVGRTFTVAGSLSGFVMIWKQMFAESRVWTLFDGSLYQHGLNQKDFYVAMFGIALILLVDMLHERGISIRKKIGDQKLVVRWVIYYGALFALIVVGVYGPAYDAASFVYGAF